MPKVERTIFVDQYYEVWSEEALEAGETDDKGHDFLAIPYTLRDLIAHLKDEGFIHFSASHSVSGDVWVNTEGDQDFISGDREVKSIHLSSFNRDSRAERIWGYALTALKNFWSVR